MGIHDLMKLLKSDAPTSFCERSKGEYTRKVIAIDASIAIYQFLAQIRTNGAGGAGSAGSNQHLVNDSGEVTSHLQGFFNRTINLLENGIKPVYVFDGKPPGLKYAELNRRKELKKKAAQDAEDAALRYNQATNEEEEQEALDDMNKASRRNLHVTKKQTEDVKKLLRLMGIPVVNAPGEAEAQCAELVRGDKCFAVGTEDMDALTFGSKVMLRKLTMPESSKEKVIEIHMDAVLESLKLTYDEFVDLCILCGCDYMESIKGIGHKTAIKMIRQHKCIENVVEHLPKRYNVPDKFMENLDEVRALFKNPHVQPADSFEFVFEKFDRPGIIQLLVNDNGFNLERVNKALDKINAPKKKIIVPAGQPTIDSFFVPKQKGN